MRFRKAQAAMEFLMTYGWALLVVLVVIGALAYFGVLNPSKLVPDKCIATAGISCSEYKMVAVGPIVKVVNGMGSSAVVTALKFTSPDSSCSVTDTDGVGVSGFTVGDTTATWGAGTAATLTVTCPSGSTFVSGGKARGTILITYYTTDPSFTHDANVEITATVATA